MSFVEEVKTDVEEGVMKFSCFSVGVSWGERYSKMLFDPVPSCKTRITNSYSFH